MKYLAVAFLAFGVSAFAFTGCAPTTNSGSNTTAHKHAGGAVPTSFATLPKAGMRAKCPVMGHAFTIQKGTAFAKHNGRYYVFCCPGCKPKFEANPTKYIN